MPLPTCDPNSRDTDLPSGFLPIGMDIPFAESPANHAVRGRTDSIPTLCVFCCFTCSSSEGRIAATSRALTWLRTTFTRSSTTVPESPSPHSIRAFGHAASNSVASSIVSSMSSANSKLIPHADPFLTMLTMLSRIWSVISRTLKAAQTVIKGKVAVSGFSLNSKTSR